MARLKPDTTYVYVALAFALVLLCLVSLDARQTDVQSRVPKDPAYLRSPRNANYDIDVRLDRPGRRLVGRETIRWRNISANPTSELQFHLY